MKKKAIAICSVGIVVLAVSILFFTRGNSAGAQQYTAEDYREGQEQFIRFIGEENFAKFEHNHPPLNCSDAEWEKFLNCSETWIHRFDMLEYVQPEFLQPESQENERPSIRTPTTKTPTTPTPAPEQ